ncbi:Mth938-like domain-containing protein [Sphingomonas sp. 28-63-12]|uniref:Mth938-like domain-containing protein n=1 Tax=Sphingomonas sp. 28-63-12 TaxID=1970434 RepID=UPI000BC635A3|nr:MAG: hypothetical protein B7Y47_13245 [Sphingomonas sp. 28-63-12]
MRLEHESAPEGPIIKGFSGGGFRIDDNVYTALLITPMSAHGWSPPPIGALVEADLATLLAIEPRPEFLILGTGARLIQPPRILVRAIEARGIGIETMDSRAAARAWSVLRQEGRWIAGALYPL